jgi:hypothetical protein
VSWRVAPGASVAAVWFNVTDATVGVIVPVVALPVQLASSAESMIVPTRSDMAATLDLEVVVPEME